MMRFFSALLLCSLSACSADNSKKAPFELMVRVFSDPDRPLPGATLLHGGSAVGKTDAEGSLKLAIQGSEGEVVEFAVKCPPKFRSPGTLLPVTLHRLGKGRLAEYSVSCPPEERQLVIAIRAENGADLPVLYLGQQVTRTDASGTAHFLISARSASTFQLRLGTNEPGRERLRPQNPTMKFVVPDSDEVILFDQKFLELEEKKKAVRRFQRPVFEEEPEGPIAL